MLTIVFRELAQKAVEIASQLLPCNHLHLASGKRVKGNTVTSFLLKNSSNASNIKGRIALDGYGKDVHFKIETYM